MKKNVLYESGLKSQLYLARKNSKLIPNLETAFIIFSLPRIITCPFATAMCKRKCYVAFEERFYDNVLPARLRNYEISKSPAFVPLLTDRIRSIANRCRKERVIVRIHEGGDFYNQEYTDKWLEIINNLSDDKRVKFVAYTKSFQFFDGISIPSNFALRASLWADTAPEQLAIVLRNGWATYSAVESFSSNDQFTHCRCENCATCNFCWQNYQDIRCLIHSGRQNAKPKDNIM